MVDRVDVEWQKASEPNKGSFRRVKQQFVCRNRIFPIFWWRRFVDGADKQLVKID